MYYIMILIAVILLALGLSMSKLFQSKMGNSVTVSLLFTSLSGMAVALIFLVFNRFRLEITPFSLLMATILSILSCTYSLIGFKILALGAFSLYTMFLMLGGMLLPYFFGIIFLNESVSMPRIIGVILLVISLIIPVLSNKNEKKQKNKTLLFAILCLSVFILNGFVSITSKVHQISDLETVSSVDFTILSNGISGILSSISLAIICAVKKEKPLSQPISKKTVTFIATVVFANAVLNGSSFVLQLIGAANVPASVIYPMITGGSMFLTAVVGAIAFQEYPSKQHLIGLILSFVSTFLFLF